MSNDLKNFCREVLTILESGEKPEWFTIECGLCYNSREYDRYHSGNDFDKPTYSALRKEIGWGDDYPFNSDDGEYITESSRGLLYQNKKRLGFLHKYAELET